MSQMIYRTALVATCLVTLAAASPAAPNLLRSTGKELQKDAWLHVASALAKSRPAGMALISEMAQKATGKKQEPQGITDWIKSMVLPQAKQTRNEMQNEVDSGAKEVSACFNLVKSASSDMNFQMADLSKSESTQSECRLTEENLNRKQGNLCGDFTSFAHTMAAPMDLGAAKAEQETKRGTDIIENSLRRNYEFLNGYFPKFMDKKKGCLGSTAEHEAQTLTCAQAQITLEGTYCHIDHYRTESCGKYDECYKTKSAYVTNVVIKVKELEAHTKAQFQTMSCFGDTMGGHVPAAVNDTSDCDPATIDTAHLDVDYPEIPDESDCLDPVKTTLNLTAFQCKDGLVVSKSSSDDDKDGETNVTAETANDESEESAESDDAEEATGNETVAEANATALAESSDDDSTDADDDTEDSESSDADDSKNAEDDKDEDEKDKDEKEEDEEDEKDE